jgi:hypothetical protein
MTNSLGHGDLADLPRPRRGRAIVSADRRPRLRAAIVAGTPAAVVTRPRQPAWDRPRHCGRGLCGARRGRGSPGTRFCRNGGFSQSARLGSCWLSGSAPTQRVPALRMGLPALDARFVFAFPHGRLAPVVQTITCPRAQRCTVVSTVTRASRRMPKAALAACTRSSGIGCAASSVPIRLQNAAGVSARAGATRPTASVTTAAVTTHTTLCLDRASNVDDSPPSHLVGPSIAVRRSSGHRTGHRLAVRR